MLLVLLYRMRARWQVVAVIVLLLILTLAVPDAFYSRIDAVISRDDATGSGRLDIWRVGVQAIERSGFVGVGLDNFPELFNRYAFSHRGFNAHNIYLMVLIELGVVGLALMLAAIGSHLLDVRSTRKTGHSGVALTAIEAACVGQLMSAVFADYLWIKSFWFGWTLLTWAIYCESTSDEGRNVGVSQG
jgi:O-antigen ligase